jgi:preprotein translocase subunit SecE
VDRITLYIRESYNELVNKVTWPTWSELLDSTRVVLVATVLIALIIFLMDVVSKQILTLIYNM